MLLPLRILAASKYAGYEKKKKMVNQPFKPLKELTKSER